jgi:hypothetical protein
MPRTECPSRAHFAVGAGEGPARPHSALAVNALAHVAQQAALALDVELTVLW